MPATTNDTMMAGPASMEATRPVMTKMPAPMMAPMPSEVRPTGPSTRRRRFSPSASASNVLRLLRANIWRKNMNDLRAWVVGAGGRGTDRRSVLSLLGRQEDGSPIRPTTASDLSGVGLLLRARAVGDVRARRRGRRQVALGRLAGGAQGRPQPQLLAQDAVVP